MEPNKFGVATFLDGHTEDILWYKEFPIVWLGQERIEFKTQSGHYVYISELDRLENGMQFSSHRFYNNDFRKQADIRDITLIKYDRKTAGIKQIKPF